MSRYSAEIPSEMFERAGLRRRYGRPRRLYRWLIAQVILAEIEASNDCIMPGPKTIEITIISECEDHLL